MLRNVFRNSKQAVVITRLMSRTAKDSYVPQSPWLWEASTSKASEADLALLRRGDFNGVASKDDTKIHTHSPEISLARLQRSYLSNYRVPADSVLAFVLELETNHTPTIMTLTKSPEKWLPLLISSCGLSMSNLDAASRQIIFSRLWKQIKKHDCKISIGTYNAKLKVLLENEVEFEPEDELKTIEGELNLQPNMKTFYRLLKQTALRGNIDQFKSLVYKMGTAGCVVDAKCHALLTYCMAVRGFHQNADSLVEQAELKYDKDAYYLALGACAKAAAARGDVDRLRKILRRSVSLDAHKRILLSPEDVFDVIWKLSSKNNNNYGRGANLGLVEQILERMNHPKGFFRLLFREVERHATAGNYYTSFALLSDMTKVADSLENQQKNLFLTQFFARICRQLVRSRTPMNIVKDLANRVNAIFNGKFWRISMYDEILYASLMYRGFDINDKFNYVSALIDTVDNKRQRAHIILPLIASGKSIEERLQIIYRCGTLGYKDLSKLDAQCLVKLVLKPLHDSTISQKNTTRVDKTAKILKSYGLSDPVVFSLFYQWYKVLENQESKNDTEPISPLLSPIRGWLRHHHGPIFDNKTSTLLPAVTPTFDRLKSIIESRDSSKAVNYVLTYGWPEDMKYEEIISDFLEIVLTHEEWPIVKKFLISLSTQCGNDEKSVVKNFHILRILTRAAEEGDEISLANLIDYCYELKRLFPRAIHEYEHFFDALHSYNYLFYRIFERLRSAGVDDVDAAIEFLKTLVKLEYVTLHPTETLTTKFINNVLRKIGWNEAVTVWMKFQSGMNCSNGIVALIRHCIAHQKENTTNDVQYLLHKAQNFISSSKVHLLYAGVLISMRKQDEAIAYLENFKSSIDGRDCQSVIKLFNALKLKSVDEEFLLKFLDVTLKYTDLKDQPETLAAIKDLYLRTCETKNLAPLGLRIYKKLKDCDVLFEDKEKSKLWKIVENHSRLTERWIFGDQGLLRINKDDEIFKSIDIYSIREELRQEINGGAAQ